MLIKNLNFFQISLDIAPLSWYYIRELRETPLDIPKIFRRT